MVQRGNRFLDDINYDRYNVRRTTSLSAVTATCPGTELRERARNSVATQNELSVHNCATRRPHRFLYPFCDRTFLFSLPLLLGYSARDGHRPGIVD